MERAQRVEAIAPPRHKLVRIRLVPHIEDELVFGAVEKAVNCEDEKSAIRSDIKVETATRRAILVNEGEGYGLLLDPAAVTATQIKTPQGSLTLNVKTKEVSWDLAGQRDGSVILEYMLLVGMQPVSALRVSLFLKK